MRVKTLKQIHFRGKKYKKGSVIDLPQNLANKMILNALAQKA